MGEPEETKTHNNKTKVELMFRCKSKGTQAIPSTLSFDVLRSSPCPDLPSMSMTPSIIPFPVTTSESYNMYFESIDSRLQSQVRQFVGRTVGDKFFCLCLPAAKPGSPAWLSRNLPVVVFENSGFFDERGKKGSNSWPGVWLFLPPIF